MNKTQNLTADETAYVASYCDVIRCVASVKRFVTSAHRCQLDTLEAALGEERAEELRNVAERRMGLA